MPLINLVIILLVVGVLLWVVNTYIPMDRKIKNILNIVVVVGTPLIVRSETHSHSLCSGCYSRRVKPLSPQETTPHKVHHDMSD